MNKKRNSKKGGGLFSCKSEVCQALNDHGFDTDVKLKPNYKHCDPNIKKQSWKILPSLPSMPPLKLPLLKLKSENTLIINEAMEAMEGYYVRNNEDKKKFQSFLKTIIDLCKDKKIPDVFDGIVSDESNKYISPLLIIKKYEICKENKVQISIEKYNKSLEEYKELLNQQDIMQRSMDAGTHKMTTYTLEPPEKEYSCEGEREDEYLPVIKVNEKHINLLNDSDVTNKGVLAESLFYDISTSDKLSELISVLNKGNVAAIGGKKHYKKDILGKSRCIYKIKGDRKEYVKHKGKLITVKEYKAMIKAKAKKPKKQPKQKVQKKST
tara:strand:- start:289 stop:1260 length:972 start_codon:yes stop_codon:yes gene_type:complete